MLPELSENDARGEIAVIYAEIRDFCAVPYVSSLQRHLATRPGWLEWVWAAIRPAFVSGRAQEAAWSAVSAVRVPALAPLSPSALRLLGVDDNARAAIANTCESFIRVSPTNLICSGLVRRFLSGEQPRGTHSSNTGASNSDETGSSWRPPPKTDPLPSLISFESISDDHRAVLMQLGNDVAGHPFVPGFYRMLAHWPGYLAHTATELVPHLSAHESRAACAAVLGQMETVVDQMLEELPPLPSEPPMPDQSQFEVVGQAIESYRKTSPEMVVFGRMIKDALPK